MFNIFEQVLENCEIWEGGMDGTKGTARGEYNLENNIGKDPMCH